MNEVAQMNANAGPYAGLDRFEARKKCWKTWKKAASWSAQKITWFRWASATAAKRSSSRGYRRSGS